MRKNINIEISILIVFILCSLKIYGQTPRTAEAWYLDGSSPSLTTSTSYDFKGRDEVVLKPGFDYKPDAGKSFIGRIDESIQLNNSPSTTETPNVINIDMGAQVGTINGEGYVSSLGAAQYNIPIELPQGANGLMPNLSVIYNSQSGNGILGWGWHLGGLSSINRVPKTVYHNGINRGVNFSDDDYAIDGNRIILGTDSKYHTEVESFSQITIFGPYENPSGFNVATKSGLLYEYSYPVMGIPPASCLL